MSGLLYIGDIHFKLQNPVNRTDNYLEAVKLKLLEVFDLAKELKVDAIVCPGDIFETPEVSHSTIIEFVNVFSKCPCYFYTAVGNHDIFGHNPDTYYRSSLYIASLILSETFEVCQKNRVVGIGKFRVKFLSYDITSDSDTEQFKTSFEYGTLKTDFTKYNVIVAHSMVIPGDAPFSKYLNLYSLETTADLVLCGHYHTGFGVKRIKNGSKSVPFINCGSLTRTSASKHDIDRDIYVTHVAYDEKIDDIVTNIIALKNAKKGTEVLNRDSLEFRDERIDAMEEFENVLKSDKASAAYINVEDMIEHICRLTKVSENIKKKALDAIQLQRIKST